MQLIFKLFILLFIGFAIAEEPAAIVIEDKANVIKAEQAKYLHTISQLEADKQELRTIIQEKDKELQELKAKAEDKDKKMKESQNVTVELRKKQQLFQESLASLQTRLNQAELENKAHQAQLEKTKQEVVDKDITIKVNQSVIDQLKEDQANLTLQLTALKDKLKVYSEEKMLEKDSTIESLNQELVQKNTIVEKLNQELVQKNTIVESLNEDLNKNIEMLNQLKDKVIVVEQQLETSLNERDKFEDQLQLTKLSLENFKNSTNDLLKQRKTLEAANKQLEQELVMARETLHIAYQEMQNKLPVEYAETIVKEEVETTIMAVVETDTSELKAQAAALYKQFSRTGNKNTGKELLSIQEQIAAATGAQGVHTIQRGDYLSRIAKKVYKDGAKWRDIVKANEYLDFNPNNIRIGSTVILP